MLKNKKMDSNIVVNLIKPLDFILGDNFLLGNFVTPLDLLNEPKVIILDIALLENDWRDLVLRSEGFLRLRLLGGISTSVGASFSLPPVV